MDINAMLTPQCQCPDSQKPGNPADYREEEQVVVKGHRPGKCPGTFELLTYSRAGQVIWLCSSCWQWGEDVPFEHDHGCGCSACFLARPVVRSL